MHKNLHQALELAFQFKCGRSTLDLLERIAHHDVEACRHALDHALPDTRATERLRSWLSHRVGRDLISLARPEEMRQTSRA